LHSSYCVLLTPYYQVLTIMDKNSKIYIAGHGGLVGSAIYRCLRNHGYTNLITRTHGELDLERQTDVEAFFEAQRPEYVFLAAAKVGGIWANSTYPAEFIYRNLTIQINIIHASWRARVERLLFLGSSCIYPRECPQPMKEEYLLTGLLEPTNQPYAVAKIAGIVQCEAYNRQYGTHYLAVMPTNLYGPNDNFDLESSHVLPALIRKSHLAKLAAQGDWGGISQDEKRFGLIPDDLRQCLISISKNGGHNSPLLTAYSSLPAPAVALWGTGSPYREFLHVDDLADACVFLLNLDDTKFQDLCSGRFTQSSALSTQHCLPLINIGCGKDQIIRELSSLTAQVIGFNGKIVWDPARPDGTPRKLLDTSRLNALGWSPSIDLEIGLKLTYAWYISQVEP
jgi:GDP-L-fucose synthase